MRASHRAPSRKRCSRTGATRLPLWAQRRVPEPSGAVFSWCHGSARGPAPGSGRELGAQGQSRGSSACAVHRTVGPDLLGERCPWRVVRWTCQPSALIFKQVRRVSSRQREKGPETQETLGLCAGDGGPRRPVCRPWWEMFVRGSQVFLCLLALSSESGVGASFLPRPLGCL